MIYIQIPILFVISKFYHIMEEALVCLPGGIFSCSFKPEVPLVVRKILDKEDKDRLHLQNVETLATVDLYDPHMDAGIGADTSASASASTSTNTSTRPSCIAQATLGIVFPQVEHQHQQPAELLLLYPKTRIRGCCCDSGNAEEDRSAYGVYRLVLNMPSTLSQSIVWDMSLPPSQKTLKAYILPGPLLLLSCAGQVYIRAIASSGGFDKDNNDNDIDKHWCKLNSTPGTHTPMQVQSVLSATCVHDTARGNMCIIHMSVSAAGTGGSVIQHDVEIDAGNEQATRENVASTKDGKRSRSGSTSTYSKASSTNVSPHCRANVDVDVNVDADGANMSCSYEWLAFDLHDMHSALMQDKSTRASSSKVKEVGQWNVKHTRFIWDRAHVTAYHVKWLMERQALPMAACVAYPPARGRSRSRSRNGNRYENIPSTTAIAGALCSPNGLLSTVTCKGGVIQRRQLPLVNGVIARSAVVLRGQHEMDLLLCVFCVSASASALASTSTSVSEPFALVFQLNTLDFLVEVRRASRVQPGYFFDDLQAGLLWLPSATATAGTVTAMPMLTSVPNMSGVHILLSKGEGMWRHHSRGSALALSLASPQTLASQAVASKTKTTSGGKGKCKDKAGTTTVGIKKRKATVALSSTASNAADSSSHVPFEDISLGKQLAVLTALQNRLDGMKIGIESLLACKLKKEKELVMLRTEVARIVNHMHTKLQRYDSGSDDSINITSINSSGKLAPWSRGNAPGTGTGATTGSADRPGTLSGFARHHVPLFPKKRSADIHTGTATAINQSIPRSNSSSSELSIQDCICLCDERSYCVMLIVRAVNTSAAPVYDATISCSLSRLTLEQCHVSTDASTGMAIGNEDSNSSTLSTFSAVASCVAPHQEAWISVRVQLSPLHFAKYTDPSGAIYLHIGLIWRQLRFSSETTKKEHIRQLEHDEAKACFEVRNGWIPSFANGCIGAVAAIKMQDMHQRKGTSTGKISEKTAALEILRMQQIQLDQCAQHRQFGPFIVARMYPGCTDFIDMKKRSSGRDADKQWAASILSEWLQGRSEQHKPMPSYLSSWPTPAGGVRYWSYLPGVDFTLHTANGQNTTTGSENVMSSQNTVQWMLDGQERSEYQPIRIQHPTVTTDAQGAGLSADSQVLLQIIPELNDSDTGYISTVLLTCDQAISPSEQDQDKDQHQGSERNFSSLRILAPLFPHAHTNFGGVGMGMESLGPISMSLASIKYAVQYLHRELPQGMQLTPVWTTDYRLDSLRLAIFYLLEDVKMWAVAWKLHRSRLANLWPSFHDNNNNSGSKVVAVGRASVIFIPVSLAVQCQKASERANLAVALALEACNFN